jgi:hypothetical protein
MWTGSAAPADGWYTYRVRSLSKGLLVGLVVAAFLAFLVAAIPQPDGQHYWIEIMLPERSSA